MVTFVMNYLQLNFDGPNFTILTDTNVLTDDGMYSWNQPGFRDAICSFITKVMRKGEISENQIDFEFDNEQKIIIPLNGEVPSNEAVIFNDHPAKVW